MGHSFRVLCLISLISSLIFIQPATAASLGKLAYVRHSQLWVKTLPDGKPIKLTSDRNIKQHPRWSPSGKWIAYSIGPAIRVQTAINPAYRTIKDTSDWVDYAWSPVSDTLAYVSHNGDLWTIRFATQAGKTIAEERMIVTGKLAEESNGVMSFTWSPDGKKIAYVYTSRYGKPGSENEPGLTSSIRIINADGTNDIELLNAGPNTYLPIIAAWSPDRKYILYWHDDMYAASLRADGLPMMAVPAKGGKPRQIIGAMLTYSDFFSFSPDGKRMVASVGGNRMVWENEQLSLVDLSTGKSKRITPRGTVAISPTWSPDGKSIAYVASPEQNPRDINNVNLDQRKIRIINPDSLRSHQLTQNRQYRDEYPQWSPDGSKILFIRINKKSSASVWLMDRNGNNQRMIAPLSTDSANWQGYYGYVDWSEDLAWWRK